MCLRYNEWWEDAQAKAGQRGKKNLKIILKISDIDEDLLDNIQIAYSSW